MQLSEEEGHPETEVKARKRIFTTAAAIVTIKNYFRVIE